MAVKDIVIEIASGKIRGAAEEGIYSFKGIPYGGPTGGANRFMPPTPPEPWFGVMDCRRYGPSCWQYLGEENRRQDLLPVSEDCLVLNVWTPGCNDNRKRPVMVWLHGGGFFGESASSPREDGASLAGAGDIVFVSVNHRLGLLGYLFLGDLADERYASSGNNGMLDLVAALEWVRDNIAVFGGDPGNVTVGGVSGGGLKASTLMAMPSAQGLFRRAIVQSGPNLLGKTREEATAIARQFMDKLGVKPGNTDILHELDIENIIAAGVAITPPGGMPMVQFIPVAGVEAMPAHPFSPVAAPTAANVPLIVGCTKDEWAPMALEKKYEAMDEAGIIGSIKQVLAWFPPPSPAADRVDDIIAVYRRTRPGVTLPELLSVILSEHMRITSIRLVERKATGGPAPVFMYQFAWEYLFPGGKLRAAPHGSDMPFVLNKMDHLEDFGKMDGGWVRVVKEQPEVINLAKIMSGAWLAFIHDGDPNHQGMPHWPPYSIEKRATMIFDAECRVENDPAGEERKAWNEAI